MHRSFKYLLTFTIFLSATTLSFADANNDVNTMQDYVQNLQQQVQNAGQGNSGRPETTVTVPTNQSPDQNPVPANPPSIYTEPTPNTVVAPPEQTNNPYETPNQWPSTTVNPYSPQPTPQQGTTPVKPDQSTVPNIFSPGTQVQQPPPNQKKQQQTPNNIYQ